MRVGMIADQVPGFVPLAQEFFALFGIHAHAADKERDIKIPFAQRFDQVTIGFAPGDVSADRGARVVHGQGDARPFGRGGAERERRRRYQRAKGAAEEFTAAHGRNYITTAGWEKKRSRRWRYEKPQVSRKRRGTPELQTPKQKQKAKAESGKRGPTPDNEGWG